MIVVVNGGHEHGGLTIEALDVNRAIDRLKEVADTVAIESVRLPEFCDVCEPGIKRVLWRAVMRGRDVESP